MMLATDSTAPRISNSWSAQCRNDGTVVSLWFRDVMRCAPWSGVRFTETQIQQCGKIGKIQHWNTAGISDGNQAIIIEVISAVNFSFLMCVAQ